MDTFIADSINGEKRKTSDNREEESSTICPVMKKNGYYGKNAECSFQKFREMIPSNNNCCSVDKKRCLLVEVPGYSSENKLLEEIVFIEYYKENLHEDLVKKQIVSFFTKRNIYN